MTIGERLEEARKRRGISIREAAEATKIRGDYLMSMEDNSMDIDLPEIYKRGFLKNYARFLKIDPDKLLTDYDAQQIGKVSSVRIPGERERGRERERDNEHPRESFGRMELKGHESASFSKPERNAEPQPPPAQTPGVSTTPLPSLADNMIYVKVAAGVLSVLLLGLLIFALIRVLQDDSSVEINPELAETTVSSSSGNASSETTSPRSITLRAEDSVTIIVDQIDPEERLYFGTLNAGEIIPIEKTGPVKIRFSNGPALIIEQPDGKTLRPASEGSFGQIVIP